MRRILAKNCHRNRNRFLCQARQLTPSPIVAPSGSVVPRARHVLPLRLRVCLAEAPGYVRRLPRGSDGRIGIIAVVEPATIAGDSGVSLLMTTVADCQGSHSRR